MSLESVPPPPSDFTEPFLAFPPLSLVQPSNWFPNPRVSLSNSSFPPTGMNILEHHFCQISTARGRVPSNQAIAMTEAGWWSVSMLWNGDLDLKVGSTTD